MYNHLSNNTFVVSLEWKKKGHLANYLCSVTLNTLLERFFAKKNQNLTPVIFPCGRHGCASQHHTMRHEDRERYTLQCLTAPHHETRGQREVHFTVSHNTAPWDTRRERGTHDCVSQHPIVWADDNERYIWLSDSTTLYDRRTDKNTPAVCHSAKTSKNKRPVFVSLRCPALCSSFYTEQIFFKSFVRLCAGSHMMRDSRAVSFSHWDILVCWTNTRISFLFWHSNVNKT